MKLLILAGFYNELGTRVARFVHQLTLQILGMFFLNFRKTQILMS